MESAKLETLIRQILLEELGASKTGIAKATLNNLPVDETHRLDTGNPTDRVYTRDLFTLEQSPRLGAGLMVMERTTFPWKLNYDELDYVLEGRLDILSNGTKTSAGPGELLLIPKGSTIQFSAPDRARFLYVTYPADWQNQE